jgi:hypothetical protein
MQYRPDHGGHAIVAGLLERPGYDRDLAHGLLDQARSRSLDWASRRLAVLALEHRLLCLDPAATDELVPFLARLGYAPEPGARCHPDVLKQGYTTVEPPAFAGELIRRLARLSPIHDLLRRADAVPDAVAGFAHVAGQECLLTLGRAAFAPEEVVLRVLQQVCLTSAEIDPPAETAYFQQEARLAVDRLPAYEADILARLMGPVRTWWTRPDTPSTLNALVETPIGSVALVIRPPGSTTEFEIKRTGVRGRHPLSIAFELRGAMVAPSHRLQGATTLSVLRWEAANSALLSALFRLVHGEAAPISRMLELRTIKGVPRPDGGEVQLSTWFNDPAAFGAGFTAMRHALQCSLSAFVEESKAVPSVPRSAEARTRAFLSCMTPAQCTLVGTSALRLDKISAWLRDGGPNAYFRAVHGRAATIEEAYRIADTILLEILGCYRPPPPTGGYAAYVAAAFADRDNRAAADRAFAAALASIGRLWGTLLGFRGYAEGECFVPRNVGLRSVWTDGAWRVQIIFMDHELTNVVGKRIRHFHPRTGLPGMHKDLVHILGGELGGRLWPGCIAVLADIYRVDAAVAASARAGVTEEAGRAYRIVHRRLRDDAAVRSHFLPSFVDSVPAFDAVVRLYRASRLNARPRSRWKGAMRPIMTAHGLDEQLIKEYRRAIRRRRRLLRTLGFLFDADGAA